jgi:hypothetical protein
MRHFALVLLVALAVPSLGARDAAAANGQKTGKLLGKIGNVLSTPIKIGKLRVGLVSKVKEDDDNAHLNVGLVAIGGKHAVGLFYAKGKKSATSGFFSESDGAAVSGFIAKGEHLAIGAGGALSEEGPAFGGIMAFGDKLSIGGLGAGSTGGHGIGLIAAEGETGAHSLVLSMSDYGQANAALFAVGDRAYAPFYANVDYKAVALFATGPREAKKRSLLQLFRKLLP